MMIITVEISYYPLADEYYIPVNGFIHKLKSEDLEVKTGKMSTMITGEFDKVMRNLTVSMKELMEKFPSVFTMKISNACRI